jgi:hypothetical protein
MEFERKLDAKLILSILAAFSGFGRKKGISKMEMPFVL